jgi:ferric-dicitrate binding protein FerR (iron transport regulator)
MNAEDFDTLCAQFLDGPLTEEERDRLVAMLEADPEKLSALRTQLLVSGALGRMNPDLSDENFLHSVVPHLARIGEEHDGAFAKQVMNTIRFTRVRRAALAVAALVALVLTLSFFLRPAKPVVAKLYGAAENTDPVKEVRIGDKIEFPSGVSRMEFANGAVVAVEGPAALTVRSADEVSLDHGRLNAWCPETAHGFRVVTGSATLTDLGTSFGVSTTADGTADFVVLDGKVTVTKDNETRTLVEGGALQSERGKKLRDVAFEPSPFQRTWPVASGIRTTKGEVVAAPPGTPKFLAALENDQHILVIPERRDVVPEADMRADITGPGIYEGTNLHSPTVFEAAPGAKVRSYLLRYNPVGKVPPPDFKRYEGSVTFDRPVLAIITHPRKLERTDKRFSKAPLPPLDPQDINLRGLEREQTGNFSDRVVLSEDRRTVTVTFYAGESIDEIRAITDDGRE